MSDDKKRPVTREQEIVVSAVEMTEVGTKIEQAISILFRHLVWLILTKRPALIESRLPADWGQGYPNVWLAVSTGCKKTLHNMDVLRKIPALVRWVSTEPLLEDISQDINLDGFGWVVTGGESGAAKRREMKLEWAANLRDVTKAAGLSFFFEQITHRWSGRGVDALGRIWHETPEAPWGLDWAPRPDLDTLSRK